MTLAGEGDLCSLCGLLIQRNSLEPQTGPRHGPPQSPKTHTIQSDTTGTEQNITDTVVHSAVRQAGRPQFKLIIWFNF